METAVAASPEAQEFVRELRLLSGNLRAEYEAEREAHPIAHTNIVPLRAEGRAWSISRRLALAAAIALCACLGAIAIGTVKRGGWRTGEDDFAPLAESIASSQRLETSGRRD